MNTLKLVFRGRLGRKQNGLGLIKWIGLGMGYSLIILGFTNLIHGDHGNPDESNYINHIGALLFIGDLAFVLLQIISLIVRHANDVGTIGIIIAVLAAAFTPCLLVLGLLPSKR